MNFTGFESVFSTDFILGGRTTVSVIIVAAGSGGTVTTYTLTGPSIGNVNTPSANFTAQLGPGTFAGSASITLSDNGASGTFSVNPLTLTQATPSENFTYTSSITGTITLSSTNNAALTNPGSLSYQSNAAGGGTFFSANFDSSASLPAGMNTYSPGGAVAVVVSGSVPPAVSVPNYLSITPSTSSNVLAFYNGSIGDNVSCVSYRLPSNASGAGVFLAGSNISGVTPSHYALLYDVTNGNLFINKTLSGVTTTVYNTPNSPTLSFNTGAWIKLSLSKTTLSTGVFLQGLLFYQASGLNPAQGTYMTLAGDYTPIQQWGVNYTDTTNTLGSGYCGIIKLADTNTGQRYFDDFAIADGITKAAVNISFNQSQFSFSSSASHGAGIARVEYWVDGELHDTEYNSPYTYSPDQNSWTTAPHVVQAKAYSFANEQTPGTSNITVNASSVPPLPTMNLIHHLPCTLYRVSTGGGSAAPSTSGTGSFEQYVFSNYVDQFSNGAAFTSYINSVLPVPSSVPIAIYTNYVLLYNTAGGKTGAPLWLDWLAYADASGYNRENAFYHAASGTPWKESGGTDFPCKWFFVAFLNTLGGVNTDYTVAAQKGTSNPIIASASGDSFYLGYQDPFREFNIALGTAGTGWKFAVEYPTAVNISGQPTTWNAVTNLNDLTNSGSIAGQVWWDPTISGNNHWVTCYPTNLASVPISNYTLGLDGATPYNLFFVRVRTLGGQPPLPTTIWGRNFQLEDTVQGTGITLAYDFASDTGSVGFLNSTQYATRASGKDAMFYYETRIPALGYGPSRPFTYCGNNNFQSWAVDYTRRLLAVNPGVNSSFSDNAGGDPPTVSVGPNQGQIYPTLEDSSQNFVQTGQLHAKVWLSLPSGGFCYPNTGGDVHSGPVLARNPASEEESVINIFNSTNSLIESAESLMVSRASNAAPAPFVIVDCNPSPGYQCDPRVQISTLAYYYLVSKSGTCLSLWGGIEPTFPSIGTHWIEAVKFNLGQPLNRMYMYQYGVDPAPTMQSAINAALKPYYTTGQLLSSVAGASPNYTISFAGSATGQLTSLMTFNGDNLQPRYNQPDFRLLCPGSPTRNKYYFLNFTIVATLLLPVSGSFTLVGSTGAAPQTTGPITWNLSAATQAASIQSALQSLPIFGTGNVVCTYGVNRGAFVIAFQNNLGLSDLPTVAVGDLTQLYGNASTGVITGTTTSQSLTTVVGGYPTVRYGTFLLNIPTSSGTLVTQPISAVAPAASPTNYTVFRRDFTKGIVLYRGLSSHAQDVGSPDSISALTFNLPAGGPYYPLSATGTIGSAVTSVSLRNAEGAIFLYSASGV